MENDGRTDGVAVPSGDSQKAMFAKAMEDAGVTGNDVGYVPQGQNLETRLRARRGAGV